jgi:hypothetical protein
MAVLVGTLVLGSGGCRLVSDPEGRLVGLHLTPNNPRWRVEPQLLVNWFVVDKASVWSRTTQNWTVL